LAPESGEAPIIEWRNGTLRYLDQRRLPHELIVRETRDYREVIDAIRRLAVRGAPLIGIAAAYGLALAAREPGVDLKQAADELLASRPTAVNLRWAVEKVLSTAASAADAASTAEAAAIRIHATQIEDDRRMGELGAPLLPDGATILTHCNAGALATGGFGTALGVIKTAHAQDKLRRVLVDETRPLLQGARLTAWELRRAGIPHAVIIDSAAAGLIAAGEVQAVVVGADRIAANGDVANKVGTYGLALAAHAHGVPFYVVAPTSTFDAATPDGGSIIIEQRRASEVTAFGELAVASEDTVVLNPAFDVTPARYITAIISECEILRPPFDAARVPLQLRAVAS
jgi:methylthioribose-1-phosphate isomerase